MGLIGHHQANQHRHYGIFKSAEKKEERKLILKHNDRKLPRIIEGNEHPSL